MAKQYRVGFFRAAVNNFVGARIRKGKMSDDMYLLTTVGRKSGEERTTPVAVRLSPSGERFLVSPYGNVGWVYNVRASGTATLSRGEQIEPVSLVEVDAATAAPILKKYVQDEVVIRSFFDADKSAPVEVFVAEASRHPVFHIT